MNSAAEVALDAIKSAVEAALGQKETQAAATKKAAPTEKVAPTKKAAPTKKEKSTKKTNAAAVDKETIQIGNLEIGQKLKGIVKEGTMGVCMCSLVNKLMVICGQGNFEMKGSQSVFLSLGKKYQCACFQKTKLTCGSHSALEISNDLRWWIIFV